MFNLDKAINAIRREGLDGWLFYNVEHRDRIADLILGIKDSSINSRPWVYVVFANSPPVKISHTIEPSILTDLPGNLYVYGSWDEYVEILKKNIGAGSKIGFNFSTWNPFASFVDYGFVSFVENLGVKVVHGDNLINRFLGTLSGDGIESHKGASRLLYRIIGLVWNRLEESLKTNKRISERNVQEWIVEYFNEYNLISEDVPIVAVGKNTNNPHYEPSERAIIEKNSIVQFDIWAKFNSSGSIYGDISWVGYTGNVVKDEYRDAFELVCNARDVGVSFIGERLKSGEIKGYEIDDRVREVIEQAGYGKYLRHRTGHSIGERVHGFGVNLDSVEFPDKRPLLEGSCFSIEPGVYLEDFGVRTEIDVYIKDGKPVVSGGEPQKAILTMKL